MTLEELIYTRLVQEKELAESLAKYEGVPAVFLQKAPDDKAQGWGVSQYPRADYLVDMTADPERHSSGMVSVNVYSDDTGKPPEELAPLVRIALCDVVMQADDGAYCITWARTELFEMNDSQNPNTLVNGCSLTFLLIAFPQQITQAPDPALAMQEFLKRWETDALVINKDHIESFYEPSDFHPAIYVRISGTKKKRQTCALTWMECSMAIHVIAPTPEARNSWTRYLYDTLARLGEIILLDGAPLLFDELAVDNAADYLTRGQITIKGQYATENFSEYSHPLKETYFNKEDEEMATTKKPTEATETAEQVQADNSRAEAVKAENEAAEKLTAPVYTAEEYARAATKVFEGKYSPDIVRAAFAVAGKKEATKAEAEELVKKFANKEVKN